MDDAAAIRHHRCMSKVRVERAAAVLALVSSAVFANGVDVRHFARAPQFEYASLSPDGARVSYVDQVDSRQIVFIRDLDGSNVAATLRLEPPTERIRWCGWADSRFVLCGTTLTTRKQHAVVESTKLYAIDAKTSTAREIAARREGGHRDQVIDLTPSTPQFVLLQFDTEGRGFPEVFELDITNGKTRTVVRSHPPIRSWMSDGRGVVRLGLGYEGQTATLFVRASGGAQWEPLITQSLVDPEAIGPLAFGARDDELYVLKHHRGRAALFSLSFDRASAPALLLADPLFDIGGPLVLDPSTRELLAVSYQREAPSVHVFSERERKLRAWLDRELPNAVNDIASRSLDGSRLLVRSSSDTNPPSLYIADVSSQRLRKLGDQYPELESEALTPMRSLMYAGRDGQRIPAYLTRSTNASNPGPAIVLPHGGPETRDVREFDPLVHFLAAKGYAVLQMNFRGSLGYGAGFAAAGAQQWGGVIHNDITDGARWLIEQKIAAPQRMCIVGSR